MGIHIVSCVGERPLAVIAPIVALMAEKNFDPASVTILLLHTRGTVNQTRTCTRWLEERYPGIQTHVVEFVKNLDALRRLLVVTGTIYFNVNPGMNWQVAFITLALPAQKSYCFASDFDRLYLWPSASDIGGKLTETFTLHDLGLESYSALSPEISVTVEEKLSAGRQCNALRSRICARHGRRFFGISFRASGKRTVPPFVCDEITDRLLWVHERRGMLYLLFDLRKRRGSCRKTGDCPAYGGRPRMILTYDVELRDIFRLITAIFNPLNYILTVVTDHDQVWGRCRVEGIDCIETGPPGNRIAGYEKAISAWIDDSRLPMPKRMENPGAVAPQFENIPYQSSNRHLFVCVGDNPDPTMQAAQTHQPCSVWLFYDVQAPRIADIAKKIQTLLRDRYPDENVALLPTDHLGRNIINTLKKLDGPFAVNVTPGTKCQGLALAASARRAGADVFSIRSPWVENIVDETNRLKVVPTDVKDLLAVLPVPAVPVDEDDSHRQLWRDILKELAVGRLKPADDIRKMTLRDGKVPVFAFVNNGIRYIPKGTAYPVAESFFKKRSGGFWWEATVAQAVADCLPGTEVLSWMKWQWPALNETLAGGTYSELDVVFTYGNYVVVVSCKAGKVALEEEALLVGGEAAKRFGRFALPCIAVPYEKRKNTPIQGAVINEALVMTPRVLSDGKYMVGRIEHLIKTVKTTSKRLE